MTEAQDDQVAGQQYQSCYVYEPEIDRTSKRRRLHDHQPTVASQPFGRLLDGVETAENVKTRSETFQKLWSEKESRIKELLGSINADTLGKVTTFVKEPAITNGKIPVGFITTGPSIASHGLLFSQLQSRIQSELRCAYVHLTSAAATNLKAVLKTLIRKATSKTGQSDEDDEVQGPQGRKLLDYDLNLLHYHVQRHQLQKVVVSFQDGEAFDGGLLTELVCLLRSWLDRIPFVLLFGIGTSLSSFQEKLSKSTLRYLHGRSFDVEQADASLQRVISEAFGHSSGLRLGPDLTQAMVNRHREQVQSVHAFISSLKYAYMSHFYANPFSVLLADNVEEMEFQPEFYEAVRNLESFRRLVETILDQGDARTARSLLKDNAFLRSRILEGVTEFRERMDLLLDGITVMRTLSSSVGKTSNLPVSDIYVKAIGGELHESVLMRDLFLSMTKMEPKDFLQTVKSLTSLQLVRSSLEPSVLELQQKLESLLQATEQQQHPILSETTISQKRLRTAVVGHKVELRRTRSSMTGEQAIYLQLVHAIRDALKAFFKATLTPPQDLFLHEAFLYSFRSPYRETFSPKPRFAIERALTKPRDYLNCDCCEPTGEGLSATQPATAILYQLYLECGMLINVFDLWSAFYAVIGGEDGEDCDPANALALFYCALADLKAMGMVKHSRKRADHIAKLSWKGL